MPKTFYVEHPDGDYIVYYADEANSSILMVPR